MNRTILLITSYYEATCVYCGKTFRSCGNKNRILRITASLGLRINTVMHLSPKCCFTALAPVISLSLIHIQMCIRDSSHSPKYQKYKIDELPLITDFRQDWTYKELIPYFDKRYGKKIRPIKRQSECDIPEECSCPRCQAPKPYLYKNNGSKGQLSSTQRSSAIISLACKTGEY